MGISRWSIRESGQDRPSNRPPASTLDDLRNRGLIDAIESDQATATGWLDDAGRHLEAATKIAGLDPSGAYVLVYDSARKSVSAAFLMTGYSASSAVRAPIRLSRNTLCC